MPWSVRDIGTRALAIVSAPVLALLLYDATVVEPMVPQVRAILAAADPQDRNVPQNVAMLLRALHHRGATVAQRATVLALWRLQDASEPSTWRRQAHELLCMHLLPLHLDGREELGLYATLSYNGREHGLNALALRRFGQPLSGLTNAQAAEVVAFLFIPSSMEHRPESVAARRELLLRRVRALH